MGLDTCKLHCARHLPLKKHGFIIHKHQEYRQICMIFRILSKFYVKTAFKQRFRHTSLKTRFGAVSLLFCVLSTRIKKVRELLAFQI